MCRAPKMRTPEPPPPAPPAPAPMATTVQAAPTTAARSPEGKGTQEAASYLTRRRGKSALTIPLGGMPSESGLAY